MSDARPTRRAVLATGLATVTAFLAGCGRSSGPAGAASTAATSTTATSGPAATSAPAPSAAVAPTSAPAAATAAPAPAWALAVSKAETGLVATYTAVIKAHPALKPRLAPLLAAHEAHVTALKSSVGTATAVSAGGTDEALSRLIQAEQKASDVAAKQCLTCPSSAAALLGSIAAADASHIVVLQKIGGS
jgi:hypothetical protein